MKPGDCPLINTCPKIKAILDKDMESFQYMQCLYTVCAQCQMVRQDQPTQGFHSLRAKGGK